tara:strand:- start:386 stop:706 length:321 start_codon:yes stop_codon:yes gene_type:complete
MKNTEEQEMTLIDSILPDVVFDQIAAGDTETFLEALGEEGLHNAFEHNKLLDALRTAIATKSAGHVGEIVIEYVTNYYNVIMADEIINDLENYAERYVEGFAEQNV